MTLTELRYIVALSSSGHFRKAAELCNVSQPTLSVAIKKLEDSLGVSLFERSRHQVMPTAIGEQIIEQAKVVLQEAQNLINLAEIGKDPQATMLSLGAIYTVGPYTFPRLVSNLQKSAPDMPLFIEESYTAVLRKKLRQGELDAIFIALPFTEPDVSTRVVYEEPFVVLLPKHHPCAELDSIPAEELANHKVLLMGEGHCFRDQVLEACNGLQQAIVKDHSSGQPLLEGSSLETLKHMVASGLGITVLPKSAVLEGTYDHETVVVKPFAGTAPKREIALAWRVSFPRHQAIDLLVNAFKQ